MIKILLKFYFVCIFIQGILIVLLEELADHNIDLYLYIYIHIYIYTFLSNVKIIEIF